MKRSSARHRGPHFTGVDTSLRAVKGRHNLAVMLLDLNRLVEAERVWRTALTHNPEFLPAQVGLGEVAVKAKNRAALERQLAALEAMGEVGVAEAAVLLARWKAAEGDHAGAIVVLEDAAKRLPGALGVRVALSHIHIATASPPEVLEPAFRSILELDPHNDQARRNLEVLYRKTGRWVEGVFDGTQPPPSRVTEPLRRARSPGASFFTARPPEVEYDRLDPKASTGLAARAVRIALRHEVVDQHGRVRSPAGAIAREPLPAPTDREHAVRQLLAE
jgi:hypothetical protein